MKNVIELNKNVVKPVTKTEGALIQFNVDRMFVNATPEEYAERVAKILGKHAKERKEDFVRAFTNLMSVSAHPTEEFFAALSILHKESRTVDMLFETIWDATAVAGLEKFYLNNNIRLQDENFALFKILDILKDVSKKGGAITNRVVKNDFPKQGTDGVWNEELFVRRHLIRSGINMCDGLAMAKKKRIYEILEDEETDGKLEESVYKGLKITDKGSFKLAYINHIRSPKGLKFDTPDSVINYVGLNAFLLDLERIVNKVPDGLSLAVAKQEAMLLGKK